MYQEKTMKSNIYLVSRMASGINRARTQASAMTDRLRHDRATVVGMCGMDNWQGFHLGSLH